MACAAAAVYALCDFEDIPCEFCFVRRILELAISCGKPDLLTVRDRDLEIT